MSGHWMERMIPRFDDLWRRWFLEDPDGDMVSLGPYDSKEEAEEHRAEWLQENTDQAA